MNRPLPPLALYLHLPWCVRKCPYCDFNSHTAGESPPRERYIDALVADLESAAESVAGRELVSIFLGGGTPSLFTPDEIARLLEAVGRELDLAGDAEITMEANPGTVEYGNPRGYRDAGVNRLSIGAQSFDDDLLRQLGRIHSAADTRVAVDAARAGGFDNINIDVMYGLPGQDEAGAIADIEAAASLGAEHLSWYQLTLEPNTVFHARPPAGLPNNDKSLALQLAGQERIAALGYAQYEVSAYSRPGRSCVHNLNYWTFGDYLGLGAGAHGKLTSVDGIVRTTRAPNPLAYMESVEAGTVAAVRNIVSDDELVFEFMLNALRLTGGFASALFEACTGRSVDALEPGISSLERRGLIERTDAPGFRPTERGRLFLDNLQAEFLPPDAP